MGVGPTVHHYATDSNAQYELSWDIECQHGDKVTPRVMQHSDLWCSLHTLLSLPPPPPFPEKPLLKIKGGGGGGGGNTIPWVVNTKHQSIKATETSVKQK